MTARSPSVRRCAQSACSADSCEIATWMVGGEAATAFVIVTSPTSPPPTMNSHGSSVATSMWRQSMWMRRTRGSCAGFGSGSSSAPSARSAAAPSHCGSAMARAPWKSSSSCWNTLAASRVAKPSCGSGYAMLKKTARAPAATFSAEVMGAAMMARDRASIGLGEPGRAAPLERRDGEAGRGVDDPARPRHGLLDDELAALERAVDERPQRGLDVAARREHLVEHDGVLERDRRAGGERRRRRVDGVADEHGTRAMPRRRHEDRLDRPAHDLLGVDDPVAQLAGEATELLKHGAHQGGLILGGHAVELGQRLHGEHVHLRVGHGAQPARRARRVVEVEVVDLGWAVE